MNPLIGEVWRVKLCPVRGSEKDGLRTCVIVSPDSMNRALNTIIAVPFTTAFKKWPTRVDILLKRSPSQACLEHIRSISKERLVKRLGLISTSELSLIRRHLLAMFEE